ncbi:putative Stigma-specific Stig1 family protein [Melia azedarach]|uniref:Stigma-specific Stig1 family protein n=2 Tax=Melia azedarach TaxID=155640 RepID=A0ACC1WXW5_MELAZ|nr:putative Stigma-specific Stig1 family protein [Melia azedarach]KAJ4703957.1 putative Stigma-specific Stig1 family protein [Melia azedarach]
MALAIALAATPSQEFKPFTNVDDESTVSDVDLSGDRQELTTSLRGASRFLANRYRPVMPTCDKYPRVCRLKGSPGPDCCKKKCVNVMKDRFNCGRCGKKCKYSEMCCRGECVNVMFSKKHCGKCNNKCKKGRSCSYGMCSYA